MSVSPTHKAFSRQMRRKSLTTRVMSCCLDVDDVNDDIILNDKYETGNVLTLDFATRQAFEGEPPGQGAV